MKSEFLIRQSVRIITAYISENAVPAAELSPLIDRVHKLLSTLPECKTEISLALRPKTPAQIAASQKEAWLISFIDGRPYKTLKRHLTANGLTPELYRTIYALPADYPMVAPAYAALRAQIAKHIGLGISSKAV